MKEVSLSAYPSNDKLDVVQDDRLRSLRGFSMGN